MQAVFDLETLNTNQKINANKKALLAEKAAILAELFGFSRQPALALAA